MEDLLLNPNFNFKDIVWVWLAVSVVFGISLRLAISMTKTEMPLIGFLVTVILSSFVALCPYVGQLLCVILAAYLVYQMSDQESHIALLIVLLARVFALVIVL